MPDDTDPPPTHWVPQSIREFNLLLMTPVVSALVGALCGGGFAGCQGMKNADHVDGLKNTVVASHAETVAKVDEAAGKADEVKQELKATTAKQAAKLEVIADHAKVAAGKK